MSESAKTLMGAYGLTDMMIPLVLDDLSDEEARTRARGGEGPSIAWTIGHLLSCRISVLGALGHGRDNPWEEKFANVPATDGSDYPPLSELRMAWDTLSAEVMAALGAATEEQLAGKPEQAWHEDQTVRDQIGFLGWHEGYHMGVVGALRKSLGHKGPAEKIMEARAAEAQA